MNRNDSLKFVIDNYREAYYKLFPIKNSKLVDEMFNNSCRNIGVKGFSEVIDYLNSLKYPKIKDRLSKSYYEKLWKADTLEILNEEPFIYRENEIIYKGFIDRVVVGYKNNKI